MGEVGRLLVFEADHVSGLPVQEILHLALLRFDTDTAHRDGIAVGKLLGGLDALARRGGLCSGAGERAGHGAVPGCVLDNAAVGLDLRAHQSPGLSPKSISSRASSSVISSTT